MDEVRLDRATVHILPVVRGLPSESETVRRAAREEALEETVPRQESTGLRPRVGRRGERVPRLPPASGPPGGVHGWPPPRDRELAGPGPRRHRGRASPRGAGGAEPLASGD